MTKEKAARRLEELRKAIAESLESGELAVVIARRVCLLAAGKIRQWEQAAKGAQSDG